MLNFRTIVHAAADVADIASGMATFGTYGDTNCTIQGSAAIIATARVNEPSFIFLPRMKATAMESMDIGKNAKKATEL